VAAVARGTGVSHGGVCNTAAWRAFEAERKRRRSGGARIVPLSGDMLHVRPDDRVADPSEVAGHVGVGRASSTT
jgi:hypothetical protein